MLQIIADYQKLHIINIQIRNLQSPHLKSLHVNPLSGPENQNQELYM